MEAPTFKIPIGLSVANLGDSVETRRIYEFIAEVDSGYQAYALRSRGGKAAAALDFYVLLSAIGSVASLAGILWMAYDRFIAPRRSHGQDQAGFYIAIRRPDGTVIDLWLRGQPRDEFIQQFEITIDEACGNTDFRVEYERTVAELEQSGNWVKVDSGQDCGV